MKPDDVTRLFLRGSRWRCVMVEPLQKLGSRSEIAITMVASVEQHEVQLAAHWGPGSVNELLSIPVTQLEAFVKRVVSDPHRGGLKRYGRKGKRHG